MPDSRLRKHRPFKWLRNRQEDKSGNGNGTHQLTIRNATPKPNATPEAIENSTTTAEAEDLWAMARKILAQDKRMCLMLEEATKIVEQHGLEGVTQGTSNSEQLHSSLTAKVEELKRKEMVIQIDDHYIHVKEKIMQAIWNVLVLKDLVSTAASTSPPVAIVCACMTVALLMFIRADDQEKDLLEGLEKTSGLIPRLRMMEDLYLKSNISLPSDFTKKFKEELVSLYGRVLEFQARALCFLQRHTLERMFRNMFHEDWNALKVNIASQENEARNFTQLIEAQGRKQDMEKLSRSMQKAEERHQLQQSILDRNKKVFHFLKLLYRVCPYKERKDRVDKRVHGTCQWFTKHIEFHKWKENQDLKLLFVSAGPGCGKSVLSRYLVDEVLPAERRTICYFFFRDDYPDQKTHTIALASMLHQLFLAHPYLVSDAVLGQYDAEGERLLESFHTLWKIFIDSMTGLETETIICVIDALDECQEDERRQFVKAIEDFYRTDKNNRKLKFLLTRRPYGAIVEDFRELEAQMPTIHLSGDGETESAAISGEINLVIKKRVHDIRIRKGLDNDDEEFLERKLTAMPNQTYLWVALTMDYIRDLDGFTKGNVRETVLPETVDDAYEKILNRSKDKLKAKRLLHIVLAAARPLSVEELSLAMALKRKDQPLDDILESMESSDRFRITLRSICGLMLVVVNDKIYLLHQTVKEFLVRDSSTSADPVSSIHWKHALSAEESHKTLAKICVWNICAASMETGLNVLLRYSADYWLDHFREARFRHQDEMTNLGCCLCVPGSKLYNTWAEVSPNWDLPKERTGLILAASYGLSSVVQRFLEHTGVEVNSTDAKCGRTPLSWAAFRGYGTVVSLLLDAKADIEPKDSNGRTALSFAARNGYDTVVSLLLDAKADIESKDSNGRTALLWAAESGFDTVVSLLSSVDEMDAE